VKAPPSRTIIRVGVVYQRAQPSSLNQTWAQERDHLILLFSVVIVIDHVQNLLNNFQYDLYWPLAPTLCFCVSFVVSGMQKGRSRGLYMAVVFPMQVHQYFIIIINRVLFHLIHTSIHPSHHTHLTTLSLSRRQVRLPLVPCLNGQRRIQHKPRGR